MKIQIEKLVYGGDGIGRAPAEGETAGKAVFVPFVLPGEQVEVTLVEEHAGFARAKLDSVLTPAPGRVAKPECPYFFQCGGCHYQHIPYAQQLDAKRDILRETLRRGAKLELEHIEAHASPEWQYRNRTRLHIHHEPEFAIGYYRLGSRQLLPVELCPISSPLIQRAIKVLWEVGRAGKMIPAAAEVELFTTHDDSALMLHLLLSRARKAPRPQEAEEFAALLDQHLPELAGVALFRQRGREGGEDAGEGLGALGESELAYRAAGFEFKVSAGAFFQTNRFMTEKLVDLVVNSAPAGKLALDLYAGVGLFSLPLAQKFERVTAVESSPWSYGSLRMNAPRNVRPVRSTTEEYLARAARDARPELVVLDPPRAGLGNTVPKSLLRMRPQRITYVSCDPSTLSRDLRVLLQSGYRVEQAHVVDLFPQTFHIESVIMLAR